VKVAVLGLYRIDSRPLSIVTVSPVLAAWACRFARARGPCQIDKTIAVIRAKVLIKSFLT